MILWTFKGYVDDRGVNVFDEWYREELPPQAQAKVDWLLGEVFPSRPFIQWGANYAKKLTQNIYEIRFEINRICYRPLGAFGPERMDFTFLIGVIKKGEIPQSTIDIAEQRFDIIKNFPNRATECELE